jgi:hypothetical protein
MKLPAVPDIYSPAVERRRTAVIEAALAGALRRNADNDLGAGSIILTAPDGSRWKLVVSNSGVLSTVAA